MSKKNRKTKKRHGKGKITLSQRIRLTEKNDATRIARDSAIIVYPRLQEQMPRSNGMVLKVKVKRR